MPRSVVFLLLAVMATIAGCGRGGASTEDTDPDNASAEQVQQLVEMANGPARRAMGRDVRVMAARQLGEIGPRAKEYGAEEALQKLARDRNAEVSAAAKEALAKIGASP